MNKSAFVISVVLTTFVLMAFAGIVYALRVPQASAEVETVPEGNLDAEPTLDPSLEQAFLEREAIFQERIAEANARLEQAQKQLAAQSSFANQQNNNLTDVTETTSEQAMQAAADYLGQDNVYWVENVFVRGEMMYLVTFTTGDMVYVNLAGQVVGSAPAQGFGSSIGGAGKKTISTKEDDQSNEEHESEDEHHESEDEDHD